MDEDLMIDFEEAIHLAEMERLAEEDPWGGMCEDAPCCGCCGDDSYADAEREEALFDAIESRRRGEF